MSDPQAKLTSDELLRNAAVLTGAVERLAAENARLRERLAIAERSLKEIFASGDLI